MKITRKINGQTVEIELTREELHDAGEEYDSLCHMEDLKGHLIYLVGQEEGFSHVNVTSMPKVNDEKCLTKKSKAIRELYADEDKLLSLVTDFEGALDRNEVYWDCFWESLSCVVDEELKTILGEDADEEIIEEENNND